MITLNFTISEYLDADHDTYVMYYAMQLIHRDVSNIMHAQVWVSRNGGD